MLGLKREIDQVAKDKGIDSAEIIGALEEAMKQAARRERGLETEIEARFNEELGEIELFEFREVVESVENDQTQIAVADAKQFDPDAELGDEIGVKLDTTGFGRILAQTSASGSNFFASASVTCDLSSSMLSTTSRNSKSSISPSSSL